MATGDVKFFEQHFLFSNRLVQIILRLRSNDNSKKQYLPISIIFCYFIPMTSSLMKLLYVHFKLDYELLANEDELNIMKQYTKRSKLYVYLIIVLINLYIISITFPSIINVFLHMSGSWDDIHLTLPFPVNNVLNTGLTYYTLLIYQTLVLFIVGVIGSICYSMYWVMIQHVCSQFSVIIWKMQQPFKNDQRHIENNWCSGTIEEEWNWMIDLIQCYTRVTELIDLINDYCKMTYLIAISISMLLVFFNFLYMFQLSTVLQSASETINCCIYMAGSVSTIYISLYVGQLVIDHSNDAFVEMCQIPFYMLSIKTQKLLLLLLTRSMIQSEISIGGIYVASHETFAGVINTKSILICYGLLQHVINRNDFTMMEIYYTDYNVKLLLAHIKIDYESVTDNEEIQIMEKYTNQSKYYSYIIVDNNDISGNNTNPCFQPIFLGYDTTHMWSVSDLEILNISSIIDNLRIVIECVIHLVTSLFVTYITFYTGQMLINHSDDTVKELCNIPFYDLSIKTQKLLLFALTRSMKHCELSIGGIFIANLEIFSDVLLMNPKDDKFNIRQPFNSNQNEIENIWIFTTPKEENNWMIGLIKIYTRITKCSIPFYNLTIKTQKLLLFVLTRSMKLSQLSIGDVFVATNEIFASLYQCFIVDLDSQSSYNLLQNTLASYGISCTFGAVNLQLSTVKDLVLYVKHDYENLIDENELKITKTYTKMTKIYITIFVGYIILYGILMTTPTYISIFLYMHKSFDSVNIPYVSPVNNNYPEYLRYGLIICQIIALYILLILTCDPDHCSFKIRQPFANEKYIEKNWDNQTNEEESEWLINIIRRYTRVTKCQVPIYLLSKNNQKLLLLITMRSMKPSELSIGDLFSVSHEIFAGVFNPALIFFFHRLQVFLRHLYCTTVKEQLRRPALKEDTSAHLYQISQITMDSQSIYSLLQKILAALAISCSFGAVNLKLSTIRDLVSYIEYDYENFLDENDLKTSEKYTEITRFYIIILVGSIILYGILMTTPTVLSIFLYMYRSLDSVDIQYIFPVNSNYSGFLCYGLLMLQIIALFTAITITCEPYHCSSKIRQPFAKMMYIEKNWGNKTNQEESEWIINIIKKYTRVTKCQVPIYRLAKENQKLLLLITMRSSRPSELSIGGLFSASHEIFAEFYQFYVLNMDFQSTLTTLPTMIIVLGVNCTFIAANLQFKVSQYCMAYLKYDYERIWDEDELCILETYTKLTKIYTFFFVGFTMAYYISMTTPSILGALMHIFGFSENMNLTLPFFILELQVILQKDTNTILECFATVFETVFVVYINFYFGQMLIDHSNGAFEELCQVPFYILSKKNQKLLLLLTMRSMKPCELSIGGLFSASHEIFAGLYQISQITMDSQSIYILLQNILAALAISCSFGAVNLKLSTIRDLVSYIEYDYENLLDENDLKTSEKYTKITRFYIIILTGSIILYGILMTTPTVLSIFLYMYTSLDSVNIQYIFPVNSNNSGFLRYGLLMLQIIALFTVLIIACVIYATYLEPYHCSFKIRHPFTKEECIVKNWDNQINKKESEWIINIIKKYTRVTKYVNLINKVSRNVYIIGIILCMIMIFFDILYILELPVVIQKSTSKILECFLLIFVSIFIIYINFYFGQMLIDHSNRAFEELPFDNVNIPYVFPVNTNYSGFLRCSLLMCQIIALFTDSNHCSFKIRQPFTKEECIVKNWNNQTNKKESEWIINIIRRYTRVTKCQVPIYTLAKKNQKLLLLITMRSSRPSELSIGGLFSASHEIFAEVCNNKLLLINKFF
ncbi:hypothetical protein M0804_007461 [Polistes exclamans]|nr:hypothetical protein M0804_007461 [Polistes exclamans]